MDEEEEEEEDKDEDVLIEGEKAGPRVDEELIHEIR